MSTPAPDDLRFAAEWLRQYDDSHEGGAQTRTAEAVAAWLDAQANENELRAAARKAGVPVAGLRRKLAEMEAAADKAMEAATPGEPISFVQYHRRPR